MSKPYEIAPPIADQLMRDIYELAVRSEARGGDCFDLMCLMDQAGGVDAGIRKLIDMVRARDARLSVKEEAHQAAIEQMHFHEARAEKLESVNKSLSERLSVTMAIEECNDKIADRLGKSHGLLKELIGLVTGPLKDPVLTPMAVKAVCDKAVAHIAAVEGPSPLDRAYADAVEVIASLEGQGVEVKE